ncbi:MAG: pseudouridine synthase [Myxococcota bacterium]
MLTILHQDEALVAIDKPSGLLVHRGWGDDEVVAMTLVRDALGAWVYPVHRLDRGTSGVLLFALSSEVARLLQAEFEAHRVQKRYLALVRGVPPDHIRIDHPIPRSEDGPRAPAVTEVRRLHSVLQYSWVEARPESGRLHQVRRHLKHISHPLIGDVRYGKGDHNRHFRSEYGLHRLALHAAGMTFTHPIRGTPLELRAPLPEDLRGPLERWGLPSALW